MLVEDAEKTILGYAKKKKMNIFPKALEFAKKRHHGEIRLSGDPYIKHILDGCYIMMALGISSDVIFTAYGLHDVVENKRATIEEIRELFGDEIATLVEYLDKTGMISKVYFMQISLFIKAIILKAVDRLSNMGDMFEVYTIEKQEAYLNENEEYIFPMIRKALERFSKYHLQLLVVFRIIEILDRVVRKVVNLSKNLEETKTILKNKNEEIKELKEKVKNLEK